MATKTVEDAFQEDLDKCLELAEQFADINDENTKQFLSKEMKKLQDFLEGKQKETEKRIKEEIAAEEREIEDLKSRIDNISSERNDGSGNAGQEGYMQIWEDLKANEWVELWNHLAERSNYKPKELLTLLIKILKLTFDTVHTKAEESLADVMFQVKYPGRDQKTDKDTKVTSAETKELTSHCVKFLQNSTPFCIQSIRQTIVDAVMGERFVKTTFEKLLPDADNVLRKYISRCSEFSWMTTFKDPKIRLVTEENQKGNDKPILRQLEKLNSLKISSFTIEWPALVQGKNIVLNWHIYKGSLDITRPLPVESKVPKVPRVTDVPKDEVQERKEVLSGENSRNGVEEDIQSKQFPKNEVPVGRNTSIPTGKSSPKSNHQTPTDSETKQVKSKDTSSIKYNQNKTSKFEVENPEVKKVQPKRYKETNRQTQDSHPNLINW